jgi:hypothetical protein
LPKCRLPHYIQGSFTCRKSTTWDRRLCFTSEGRHAGYFFALINPTASAGFEPANLGTRGQHASSRPPKPLCCMLAVDTLTLSNACTLRASVQYGRAWLPTNLFSCVWCSVHSVARNCLCHLHCSSWCTSVRERYNQHSDVSVQNACVPTHIYPSLTVTFTDMCHMFSNTSTPFIVLPYFWLPIHSCDD